jgi:hypothetical protein
MWIEKPCSDEISQVIPLLRVKAGGQVTARLTGSPRRVAVHYYQSRSWPCTISPCSLCKLGISRRIYAFYPVVSKSGQLGILELTSPADHALSRLLGPYFENPEGIVTVTRAGGKRNNPLHVNWRLDVEKGWSQSKGLDQRELINCLFRIWGLPQLKNGDNGEDHVFKVADAIRSLTSKSP